MKSGMQNAITVNRMYALQDVPGRGKGLVATENISKGTRILSEEPTITVPHGESSSQRVQTSICQQVDALSEHQRQAFLSLHNGHPYQNVAGQYLGIVRSNGLPVEHEKFDGAIFLEACRINHSCDNNAQKHWNENIKRHTIHALRDISRGEEITIYYLSIVKSREERREALLAKLGFHCSCRLCTLPPEQSQESDKRLDEIYQLDTLIGRGGIEGILSSPLRILGYIDRQVQLYNLQGPDDAGLPRAFFDAAQIAIANGDLARGRIFLERAAFGWRTGEGSDSTNVIKFGALAQDPSKHELYGLSMEWMTAVDAEPCGLELGDFEDWLWKREKPQRQGQPVDFRNRSTFPGFKDLPDDKTLSLNLYEGSGAVTYQPRRHWCFLAEIMEFQSLPPPFRMQMAVNDIDGKKVPLFFYTDSRGSELASTQVQIGYTVAILYAQRHAFMFDEPGIRHEDPGMLKVRTVASPSD
jgi:hypothetical protein